MCKIELVKWSNGRSFLVVFWSCTNKNVFVQPISLFTASQLRRCVILIFNVGQIFSARGVKLLLKLFCIKKLINKKRKKRKKKEKGKKRQREKEKSMNLYHQEFAPKSSFSILCKVVDSCSIYIYVCGYVALFGFQIIKPFKIQRLLLTRNQQYKWKFHSIYRYFLFSNFFVISIKFHTKKYKKIT
ncbi:predicted protein [Lodderomyces elongisporus NRRL YB-4239]|uniref:Transmembrane protein n=1 Tax=Lodderomyces elongisporus (strain ATCC 11503 / CBS 2605 / JCM 1781 / NBRC 1676 / NRRL YB-4239) TaxID=379508 RepID=A5E1Q4_LODEL|nr:predicted protein [Lodderomyces elongisporus NRRL YB-4239]